jgi:tyrosine-protein phosphatase SIW14
MTKTRLAYRLGWMFSGLLLACSVHADPPGIPNFHNVAPGITRGAAPTPEGLKALKAMGVQTIIDLRISPPLVRREAAEAHAMGFRFINLPMGSDPPTTKQVATFLATLKDAQQHPVFVHCQHGADRTGCMVGIYRETQQGWDFTRTWTEMRRYGFNPHWSHLTDSVRRRAPMTGQSQTNQTQY